MAKKKFIGEDGKTYIAKVKKPFYKRVWFWIVAVIAVFGIAGILGGGDEVDTKTNGSALESQASSTAKEVEKSNLLIDSPFKKIAQNSGADKAVLESEKKYSASWSDDTWSGVDISIDGVSIIKVSNYTDYSENEYQGFVIIHFNIKNNERDVSIYPEQAVINTNTGQQVEGLYEMEQFAGDLLKGSEVSGYAAYPLKKLDSVDDISTLRVKFTASYETDDYNDNNANHEYDLTLELH